MQLTGCRGSASEASFDVTQPLLPNEKDAQGRRNEKGKLTPQLVSRAVRGHQKFIFLPQAQVRRHP
jgi:hypothetical protein